MRNKKYVYHFGDGKAEGLERRGLVPPLIVKREYAQALKALIALKPSIDAFFDGVLVNSPVQAVRANRLSLLYRVDELFSALADFSRIQVQGS